MPVDDAGAVQVIGGELTAYAVSRQDADAKATHLSRHVPEHHVIVVELYAKHRVRQGLDHLALEFDLVFLCHEMRSHPARSAQLGDPALKCAPPNYQRWRVEATPGYSTRAFVPVLRSPRRRLLVFWWFGSARSSNGRGGRFFARGGLWFGGFGGGPHTGGPGQGGGFHAGGFSRPRA